MSTVPKLRRPATLDHLRSKPRSRRIVEVYLDPDALQAFNGAEAEVGKATLRAAESPKPPGADKALTKARADRDAAKVDLDETVVEILLQGIGRKRFEELEQRFPPTAAQLDEWQEQVERADEKYRHLIARPPHDQDRMGAALIAASAVEPKLSEDEVAQLLDDWGPIEGLKLKMVAFQVNNQAELVELGKGTTSAGSNGTRG